MGLPVTKARCRWWITICRITANVGVILSRICKRITRQKPPQACTGGKEYCEFCGKARFQHLLFRFQVDTWGRGFEDLGVAFGVVFNGWNRLSRGRRLNKGACCVRWFWSKGSVKLQTQPGGRSVRGPFNLKQELQSTS